MTHTSRRRRGGPTAAPYTSIVLLLVLLAALMPARARAQSTPDVSAPPAPETTAPTTPQTIAPTAPEQPAPAGGPRADSGRATLSGPGHVWRWSFVERSTVVRAEPRGDAPELTRLSTRTPEGTDNLVLVLERRQVAERYWVRVRLPILPNNTTGWVPRKALGGYNRVRMHLLVDTRRLRLQLQRRGRTIFRARIGVGQRRWPTPIGQFYVRNELRGFKSPMYGPVAFGTSARSAVLTDWPGGGFIGIHGTNQPELIPGRVSHGCIRIRNRAMLRLARLLRVGTPITVT